MMYLALFLSLSAGSMAGAAFFHRKYEECLPLTIGGMVLLLYLFGICGQLIWGLRLLAVLITAVYVAVPTYMYIHREQSGRAFLRRIFTPGMLFFALAYLALIYLNFGLMPWQFDEMTHWALTVRSLCEYHALAGTPGTGVDFQSYPPGMALFQYAVLCLSRYCDGIFFDQWLMYLAYQLFALSFLFPFLGDYGWKRLPRAALRMAALLLVPMVFFQQFYSSLYIDAFLSVVGGAGWAMLFWQRKEQQQAYGRVFVALCIAVLVLAKDVGLLLASFLVLGQLAVLWQQGSREGRLRTVLPKAVLPVVTLAFAKLSWSAYLTWMDVPRKFSNTIRWDVLWRVLCGQDDSYRSEVVKNYGQYWLTRWQGKGVLQLSLNDGEKLLLLVLVLWLLLWLWGRKYQKERKTAFILGGLVTAEILIYAVGMCVMYLFKFTQEEALLLTSLGRYLSIVFSMLLILNVLLLCGLLENSLIKMAALLAGLLLLVPIQEVKNIISGYRVYENRWWWESYERPSQEALAQIEKDSRVYLICQSRNTFDYFSYRYHMFPSIPIQTVR